jgi:hypothetical protein
MRLKTMASTFVVMILAASASMDAQSRPAQPKSHAPSGANYDRLPLAFEANRGQLDPKVQFLSRGPGYTAFLTTDGMVLGLRAKQVEPRQGAAQDIAAGHAGKAMLQFRLLGAARSPSVVGENPQPGRVNYFVGNNPTKWRTNVPTFAQVRYKSVYPGIDLLYYGTHQQLEYDFAVAPGGDPRQIRFEISGATNLSIGTDGALILLAGGGEIHFQPPVVYQESRGERVPVKGGYVLNDATHVSFNLGNYDPAKPLVIDPVLVYSTYLGGSGDDRPGAIAVDTTGNIYIAGSTDSTDFPSTTQGSFLAGNTHVFVAKLDPTGSNLIYADILGGNSEDDGYALALDASNNIYVTGSTASSDFPTVNPFQGTYPGGFDAFLTKISPDGSSLLYSTYFGGAGTDIPSSIAVDPAGEMVVAGYTSSTEFPVVNAYQSTVSTNQGGMYGNYGFLSKFSPDGSSLVYSTYFAGNSNVALNCGGTPCWPEPSSSIAGMVLDSAGNAYVTGSTNTYNFPTTEGVYLSTNSAPANRLVGFVSKFSSIGGLEYSTYFYAASSIAQVNTAIAVDASGSAYVSGVVISGGTFPITSTSICDPSVYGLECDYAFVTKFDATGATLLYSTFLGPNNNASPQSIVLDRDNNAYVLASTGSNLFNPVDPIESFANGNDLLLVEIDAAASTQLFATYLGGTGDNQPGGMVLDANGNLYVAGVTDATDFPVTPSAFQTVLGGNTDAFILKIGMESAAAVSLSPSSLQFAIQNVGSSSQPQTVLLRNMGSSPLSISSITAVGDFAETDNCGGGVPAAGNCTMSVTFTPTAPGSRTGTVVIQDDGSGAPHTIGLSGSGLGASVSLTPVGLTFPSTLVGGNSASQTLALTNSGNATLSISSIAASGDYSQTDNCPATLSAGSSCTVNAVFTPTGAGIRIGAVTIADSALGSPQSVGLTGTGVALGAVVALSPTTLTFTSVSLGTSATPQTVTVTNSGNATMSFASIGATGDYSQSNTCSNILRAGSSCTIKVTFTPTQTGTRTGTVTISDSGAGTPQTVALTGRGTDFRVTSSNKTATVKAGATATYSVAVASVGGTFANAVKLSCSGAPANTTCSLSPGSVTPGSNSATATLTVSTTGTSAALAMPGSPASHSAYAVWMQVQVFGLFGMMLAGSKRRARKLPALIALLLLAGAMSFMSACAGGTGIAPQTQTGTTPGTYTITVSGTSGSLEHSVPLTLIVQ